MSVRELVPQRVEILAPHEQWATGSSGERAPFWRYLPAGVLALTSRYERRRRPRPAGNPYGYVVDMRV